MELIDKWDRFGPGGGKDAQYFMLGMEIETHGPKDFIWIDFFECGRRLSDTIEDGQLIHQYLSVTDAIACAQFAYPIELDGYVFCCLNSSRSGSAQFKSMDFASAYYHGMCVWQFDGSKYTVHLYSDTGLDVSEIAKKFGGGGHRNAAGFICEQLPWEKTHNNP